MNLRHSAPFSRPGWRLWPVRWWCWRWQGWLTGFANDWLGASWNLYGTNGIVLAHVFFNAPLAARILLQAIESAPAAYCAIALLRTILRQQPMMLLDEPLTGLDNATRDLLRQLLLEQKALGSLIVLASHDEEDRRILADSVCRL